jgi:DNA-directed RNA polymerase subunit M/transcription elongation factor TFIIS
MPDTPVVFLTQKGEIRQGKLKNVDPATLAAAWKKKVAPSLLGRYTWKQKTLFLFGYDEGKAGTENQHHLPPPLEGLTFYGDILIVLSASPTSYTSPLPFKTADYESFYTQKVEGDDEEDDEFLEEEAEAEAETTALQEDDLNVDDVVDEDEEESETEEATEASDDVEGDIQEEFEEEVPVPAPKPTRKRKAQAQVVAEAEAVETNLEDPVDACPQRKHVLNLLETRFPFLLNLCSPQEMELAMFSAALDQASKVKVHKSWASPVFQEIYKAVCRRLLGNLTPDTYIQNKRLYERFESGELTLAQMVKQNYYELCPEQWQQMVDRQAKREKIQLEGDFSRATDRWQCNKCKKRKCTYYELQTRSADEPMTIFIHCLNCGNRWTQ